MIDRCPTACPISHGAILEAHEGLVADFPYSQAIGSIMYLALDTQQDLAFSVTMVLRFVSNLEEVHIKAIKKIFCYLRATTNIGLTFGKSNNQHLVEYTNADYVGCTLLRHSISGYIFLYKGQS